MSVRCSCMDTSSKTWQSQFGLVGQAEVSCGGPGVLTPSESVQKSPSLSCPLCLTVTASSPVCRRPMRLFSVICFSMFPFSLTSIHTPVADSKRKVKHTLKPLLLFLPFTKVPQYIEDFLPLTPPPEHRSPSEPRFVTLPEFYFDIL